ncbi:Crp/Fnr family transcriptional regulator [Flavobacterium sp.]|uniref:Crp/Fnr family transcriptional regulator n=1 Tax=Flavobacterium sp. TaxID=239 RepID=UPI003753242E
MNLIVENISKHINLTPQEQELFLSKTETHHYKAKTILLNAGEVCKNSYFVNSGVLRSFNINDNIVEHVMSFACSGWWISDMYSLISQKPGNLFIEVIEDAEVVLLSKENQEQLYHEIPKLERFFRILTENALVANQQRIMDNLSLSAEDRFEKFCKKHPSLMQKVPQKQIASFIGVTPEFFSKMKARLLKKGN